MSLNLETILLDIFPQLKAWTIQPNDYNSCLARQQELKTLSLSLVGTYAHFILTILSTEDFTDFPHTITLAGNITPSKPVILTPQAFAYHFTHHKKSIIFQAHPPSIEIVGASPLNEFPQSFQHAPPNFLQAFAAYL